MSPVSFGATATHEESTQISASTARARRAHVVATLCHTKGGIDNVGASSPSPEAKGGRLDHGPAGRQVHACAMKLRDMSPNAVTHHVKPCVIAQFHTDSYFLQ